MAYNLANCVWIALSIPSFIASLIADKLCEISNRIERADMRNGEEKQGENKRIANDSYKGVNIPKYLCGKSEDSIDLQISSLTYVFRLYQINALGPFLKPDEHHRGFYTFSYATDQYSDWNTSLSKDIFICNNRLNRIYNVSEFLEALLADPYRVLIDYPKNKFRAMLILSGPPTELKELPKLNKNDHFEFIILRPEDPDERYVEVLTILASLYREHRVSIQLKRKLALKVLSSQREKHPLHVKFTKNDRASIIRTYLQKLAFHVQVERIYRATLKTKQKHLRNALLKFSPPELKKLDNARKWTCSKKSANMNTTPKKKQLQLSALCESSPKLDENIKTSQIDSKPRRQSGSIEPLESIWASDTNSDTHFKPSDSESAASSSSGSTRPFTSEEKKLFYDQSKMAVRIRIERERLCLT